jgi:hypothetical protein
MQVAMAAHVLVVALAASKKPGWFMPEGENVAINTSYLPGYSKSINKNENEKFKMYSR